MMGDGRNVVGSTDHTKLDLHFKGSFKNLKNIYFPCSTTYRESRNVKFITSVQKLKTG